MINPYDNLPAELRETGLFCLRGKKKIPINPATGQAAKSNDPTTFCDYQSAIAALKKSSGGRFVGLGVGVFGDLLAIDLDHCVGPDGSITTDAQDIIEIMDAYTEYSPSGDGIRILAKATGFNYDSNTYYIKHPNGKEIYVKSSPRHVTLTGNVIRAADLVERGEQLQIVLDKYMVRPIPKITPSGAPLPIGQSELADSQVIAHILKKAAALWNGDITGYGSHSEADLALANHLAFYCGGDGDQMDRLFRQSGLMRSKWERGDYRSATITNAITGCHGNFYNPNHLKLIPNPAADYQPSPVAKSSPEFNGDITRKSTHKEAAAPTTITPFGFELNQIGNANLLIALHHDDIKYAVEAKTWYYWWNGFKWAIDHDNVEVQKLAINTIVQMNTHGDKAIAAHRQKSQTYNQIVGMVNAAKGHEAIKVSVHDLDAQPYELNAPNGIINLITGELMPHDRSKLHTFATSVDYNPALPIPCWLKYLDETFGGAEEMIAYLQRLIGYTAIGEVTHHVVPFLYGHGANGKSVFIDVVRTILGDYATSTPSGFLMKQQYREHSTEIKSLFQKRMAISSEVSQGDKFDEQKFKELSGGDSLTARGMRENFITFTPTFTLWVMGNHLPKVTAGGEGFWRRFRLIPFTRTVPLESRNPTLAKTLIAEEGAGILAWIVEGAKQVIASGSLNDPESVLIATADYAEGEDAFGRFAEDKLRITGIPALRVLTSTMYRGYEKWCLDNNEIPLANNEFGKTLTSRYPQIGRAKSNGKRFYTGVDLWPDDDFDTDDTHSGVRRDLD